MARRLTWRPPHGWAPFALGLALVAVPVSYAAVEALRAAFRPWCWNDGERELRDFAYREAVIAANQMRSRAKQPFVEPAPLDGRTYDDESAPLRAFYVFRVFDWPVSPTERIEIARYCGVQSS